MRNNKMKSELYNLEKTKSMSYNGDTADSNKNNTNEGEIGDTLQTNIAAHDKTNLDIVKNTDEYEDMYDANTTTKNGIDIQTPNSVSSD